MHTYINVRDTFTVCVIYVLQFRSHTYFFVEQYTKYIIGAIITCAVTVYMLCTQNNKTVTHSSGVAVINMTGMLTGRWYFAPFQLFITHTEQVACYYKSVYDYVLSFKKIYGDPYFTSQVYSGFMYTVLTFFNGITYDINVITFPRMHKNFKKSVVYNNVLHIQ